MPFTFGTPQPTKKKLQTPSMETAYTSPNLIVKVGNAQMPMQQFVEPSATLNIPGVTPQRIAAYAQPQYNNGKTLNPTQAALKTASDTEWEKLARKNGVLTGDQTHDDLVWRQHSAFNRGMHREDPLYSVVPSAAREVLDATKNHLVTLAQSIQNKENK